MREGLRTAEHHRILKPGRRYGRSEGGPRPIATLSHHSAAARADHNHRHLCREPTALGRWLRAFAKHAGPPVSTTV